MASTRKLFSALTRRGPCRVLRGDLVFAGLPGVVYTPDSGTNLPAVVFGHDWLTAVDRYRGTLEHLASWGIVAAAPDTERGLAPSALNLAYDLGTTLDIVAGVRLGPGKISVHPTKLGLAGHGFGGSVAVLAAASRLSDAATFAPKAVAALFPTVSRPPAEQAAAALTIPGLVLTAPGDPMTLRSNAVELARAWDGAVSRTVSKAKPGGLIEGRRLARVAGLPGADKSTRKRVRALLTGYLLHVLAGDKAYRDFADRDAPLPKSEPVDPDAEPVTLEDKVVALLKP
ncbi:MAG: dienelactone hydrolase family protein [Mycobacteriaceae bacterium]|nr:dienelactone hydrolase family protein [Mycobacteriaceae bacterium]